MKTSDFYYELPESLIAQHPSDKRDGSNLMVLQYGNPPEHRKFSDLPEYLRPGDCLVLNNTKVMPARLLGRREDTGSDVEILLLKKVDGDLWETLVRPGRKCRVGHRFVFGSDDELRAEVEEVLESGNRLVRFEYAGIWEEVLDRVGIMPLPPYIHATDNDRERYQTVYAKITGSAAAPTAGLHFTPELLDKIREQGVSIAELTLHVGLGTFRPVKEENIEDHPMHSEYYELDETNAELIRKTQREGGRVISVGTTSCRVLESIAQKFGEVRADCAWTDIFIYPGYRFRVLDGLITNFHLPESTLLMLVSAFYGRERMLAAYHEAVEKKYRFFSFGDAMLIVPEKRER